VGEGVRRAGDRPTAYEHKPGNPLYRPLRLYSRDPAVSRLSGAVALVNLPYEPLEPGPRGALLEVVDVDWQGNRWAPLPLDDPDVLLTQGRTPSTSDPLFHQQMVYAVCSLVCASFRSALGRHVPWGFRTRPEGHPSEGRLEIRPHAFDGKANAYYDPDRGSLQFGCWKAPIGRVAGRNAPDSRIYACLSHDVIAHEVTHALLDGLRSQFCRPTGPDVMAFHEAFADLVALFQHFSYPEVVEAEIRRTRGALQQASLLTDLAIQFGQTAGDLGGTPECASPDLINHRRRRVRPGMRPKTQGLRSAIGTDQRYERDGCPAEPHARGAILVAAVFDAFLTVYRRKIAEPIRLATGGTGVLGPGELSADLRRALAQEASKLAGQYLKMCIRAIDYCPPVDVEFGEFLRAVITADRDLVPDDPYAYREAWVDAFRQRGIYPLHVDSLSEDALLWSGPSRRLRELEQLSFANLRFRGSPGQPADDKELYRQACALGRRLNDPVMRDECGLAPPYRPGSGDRGSVDLPRVESVRSCQRTGPDGQIVFDLVAEVTQRRIAAGDATTGGTSFPFYGGATLILNPHGEIRYIIRKKVVHETREAAQRGYIASAQGQRYWVRKAEAGGDYLMQPRANPYRLVHEGRGGTDE